MDQKTEQKNDDPMYTRIFERLVQWQMQDSGCSRQEAMELMEGEAIEQYLNLKETLFMIDEDQ
ncbi:hypothetical protein UFOVP210_23 [uncultured Caudovirales phage]|uniref:Uncharacterized protein n=1 Tax=uncultured Caudovirales phage TaxID=2100421 RepID=A0A6J7WJ99_9CAUD|nr:hypothetical protein UFOVP210_23 [uncultured Caudovirales phage]